MTTTFEIGSEEDLELRFRDVVGRTRLFDLPGEGFDPLEAQSQELLNFGLPIQADATVQPALHDFWARMYGSRKDDQPVKFKPIHLETGEGAPAAIDSATFKFLNPLELRILPGPPLPRPSFPPRSAMRNRQTIVSARSRRQTSRNWSGGYIKPRDGTVFTELHAEWKIPTSSPGLSRSSSIPPFNCSTWIGFDGQRRYYHSSLPQIGTEQPEPADSGLLGATDNYKAWWQWWFRPEDDETIPDPPIELVNFPVVPGDEIMCSMIIEPDRQSVKFIIKNHTNNTILQPFVVCAPMRDIPLQVSGATAEWIMERPSIWPEDRQFGFPDFDTMTFKSCLAVAASPHGGAGVDRDIGGAQLINMKAVRQGPQRTVKISGTSAINQQDLKIAYITNN